MSVVDSWFGHLVETVPEWGFHECVKFFVVGSVNDQRVIS